MSIKEHQELIQLIEIIVVRAGTCCNSVDQDLYLRTLRYLDKLQQITSKDLK